MGPELIPRLTAEKLADSINKPKDSVAVTIFREGTSMQIDVVLKNGPIADEAGVDWEMSAVDDLELKNHTTNTKFQNCHECHANPNPHPFDKWEREVTPRNRQNNK